MTPKEINNYLAVNLMPGIEQCKWDPYHNITQSLGDGGPGTVVGAMKKIGFTFRLETADGRMARAIFFPPLSSSISGLVKPRENLIPSAAICVAAVEALKAS